MNGHFQVIRFQHQSHSKLSLSFCAAAHLSRLLQRVLFRLIVYPVFCDRFRNQRQDPITMLCYSIFKDQPGPALGRPRRRAHICTAFDHLSNCKVKKKHFFSGSSQGNTLMGDALGAARGAGERYATLRSGACPDPSVAAWPSRPK